MKKQLRTKTGEFCNVKQWFVDHAGHISYPSVTKNFQAAEERLKNFDDFPRLLGVIETAIYAASEIVTYQNNVTPAINISASGSIRLDGWSSTCEDSSAPRRDLVNQFVSRFDTLKHQQVEIVAQALATSVEVED